MRRRQGETPAEAGTGGDRSRDILSATDICASFSSFIPAEEIASFDDQQVAGDIIAAIAASPVPLAILLDLSLKSGFDGHRVLEAITTPILSSGLFDLQRGAGLFTAEERSRDLSVYPIDGETIKDGISTGIPSDGSIHPGDMTVEEVFGRVSDLLGEERSGQVEMARMVLDSFESGKIAFIEAGTGTGKSLGYLVPSIIHSRRTGERVIISTYTRNLQNQLMTKEIPLLRDLFGINLDVARLMGRENYICSRRLLSFITALAGDDPSRAFSLAISAVLTMTGRVESIISGGEVDREELAAPARCLMNACSHSDTCPLLIARKKARNASIVFVNHALILTDYRQGGSVLGEYQNAVFDEAHHLENCVMENLSVRLFSRDIPAIFQQVSPISAASPRWKLFISQVEGREASERISLAVADLSARVEQLKKGFNSIFTAISERLDPGGNFRNQRTRYQEGAVVFADVQDEINHYRNIYNELKDVLKPFVEIPTSSAGAIFQQELRYIDEELVELSAALEYLFSASDDESVFWIEWSSAGKAYGICGSPLSIDRRFSDYLEEKCSSAVFTSATLAEEGSFSSIGRRLGTVLSGLETNGLVVPSPFNYRENFLIITQKGMGDPNSGSHAGDAALIISQLAEKTRRSIMVLFTSHRMCRLVARHLDGFDLPGPLFIQGISGSREELAGQFKSSRNGVLLGVASFWEGVDFPGDQLEIMVIPKLPFPVPTEPIIEARSDRLRSIGEEPFTSLYLPEAIMRLRQGIGRVIRRSTDRGVAVILDPRIESRPYSKRVISSLPVEPLITTNNSETVDAAAAWFEEKDPPSALNGRPGPHE
ncbi:MAG: hypothetical protein JW814_08300 [Candidatus Krumholzibacteriota bacterium]|nr:hypothetical protein [Candidatus Krumholzibacteriota bacterium]